MVKNFVKRVTKAENWPKIVKKYCKIDEKKVKNQRKLGENLTEMH